jgi:glycosyltransferase involved in cell wall biosynthesis
LQCIVPAIDDQVKYFVRLHDVFPISNPEWFRWYSKLIFSIGFRNAIGRAVFICDSKATQTELKRIGGADQISSSVALCPVVIPSGLSCMKCSGCKTLTLQKRHVITISTLEPRKNFAELITAWVRSEAFVLTNTQLYIVGRQGWKSSKLAKDLTKKGHLSGIYWIKDACDESVQELLRSSEFLISTSFEEGFNLSVAEALLQKIPVLISNNQVHSEIYSESAIFYEINNPKELSEKIISMLSTTETFNFVRIKKLEFGDFEFALRNLADALR